MARHCCSRFLDLSQFRGLKGNQVTSCADILSAMLLIRGIGQKLQMAYGLNATLLGRLKSSRDKVKVHMEAIEEGGSSRGGRSDEDDNNAEDEDKDNDTFFKPDNDMRRQLAMTWTYCLVDPWQLCFHGEG